MLLQIFGENYFDFKEENLDLKTQLEEGMKIKFE